MLERGVPHSRGSQQVGTAECKKYAQSKGVPDHTLVGGNFLKLKGGGYLLMASESGGRCGAHRLQRGEQGVCGGP